MKKFSKILSSVLAASLIASCFMANVMAASTAHTATVVVNKTTELKAGDVVVVTVAIDQTEKLSAVGYDLIFDAAAFEVDTTKGWDSDEDFESHENYIDKAWYDTLKGTNKFSNFITDWGVSNPANNTIRFIGSGSKGVTSAAKLENLVIGTYNLKVKADVEDGEYTFKLGETVSESYTLDAGENTKALMTGNTVTVTVGESTPTPPPAPTTKTVGFLASMVYDNTKTGVEFTVTTNDVNATINPAKQKVAFANLTNVESGNTTVTVGLNIKNVPKDTTVAATAELY